MAPTRLFSKLARVAICFTAASAFAQIQELATNADGSRLYFATKFRQTGSDQFSSYKIFQYSKDEFSLIAQTPPFVARPDGTREQDDFHFPSVSGDDSILTWDESMACATGAQPCPNGPAGSVRGFATGGVLPDALKAGSVRVSPNGRYSLSFCCWNNANLGTPQLFDALTGTITPIPGYRALAGAIQNVADDGSLILGTSPAGGNDVYWKAGIAQDVTNYQDHANTRISGDGSTLVYEVVDSDSRAELRVRDIATGDDRLLFGGPVVISLTGSRNLRISFPYFNPSISYDGSRVLFTTDDVVNSKQAFVINRGGSGLRQLTTTGAGEVTISGDGRVGYANGSVALLRIDIDSAEVTTLVPKIPEFDVTFPQIAAPGSRLYVRGGALTAADGTSLVSIEGEQAPVISAAPNLVLFQIPWEHDTTKPVTVLMGSNGSPFEFAMQVDAAVAAPAILDQWSVDYSNDLTNPGKTATAGDIIVLELVGLGPVTPQPATGQAAPLDRLSYAQLGVECDFTAAGVPLGSGEILFAGLIPTLIGEYQINVRTPASIPNDVQNVGVTCSVQTSAGVATSQPQYFYLSR